MVDVELQGISKVFQTPNDPEEAVSNMDLQIDHGDFFTFVGPSGCGKTTALRMIAGLETPTSGKIYFGDEDVTDVSPQERDVAMVFQNVALFPHMTCRENMEFPLRVRNELDDVDERINEVAELLEIFDMLDKSPAQLSGGQQQRVALGRSIIREPSVILLDEPMSDLDAKLKSELRVEVQRVHKELGTTMIYVTHDQKEAMTMSTKIGLMNDGKLEQVDSPEVIFDDPTSEFSARFIGEPSMNILHASLSEDGELVSKNGYLIFEQQGLRTELEIDDSRTVNLGFRPRDVVIEEDPDESLHTFSFDVEEPIGRENVMHFFDDLNNTIEIVSDGTHNFRNGDQIGIRELLSFHLFDPETGEVLAKVDTRTDDTKAAQS